MWLRVPARRHPCRAVGAYDLPPGRSSRRKRQRGLGCLEPRDIGTTVAPLHRQMVTGAKSSRLTAALLLCSVVAWADQPESSSASAREALALCDAADAAPLPDRPAILSRGLQ